MGLHPFLVPRPPANWKFGHPGEGPTSTSEDDKSHHPTDYTSWGPAKDREISFTLSLTGCCVTSSELDKMPQDGQNSPSPPLLAPAPKVEP